MPAPTTLDTTVLEWARHLRLVVVPLARELRQQATAPFTATQLSVISAIERHGPISITELAAQEHLAAPTISKVISSIEAEGMIERLPDASDRRVCRVRLSPAGAAWIDRGRAARNEWLASRIARLDEAEQSALAAALPVLERLAESD